VTVNPGVDLSVFGPATDRHALRRRLGVAADAIVLLFVGRIQPLKAPDVLVRAAAAMVAADPALRQRLTVLIVGGPSGSARSRPDELERLAASLGIGDLMRFEPPCPPHELADWYRVADLTVVPSYNESFGLVAVESQASGTPVVAAGVGGLRTAVRDGASGILVDGHDHADYACVIADLVGSPGRMLHMSAVAAAHAARFGWDDAVDRLLGVYTGAVEELRSAVRA
jgi:D-inositol-3-phosphate glycosyltransferase